MAVRSDPQISEFSQLYDEDGDDSDDNHFIISLEDNGDEDEPDCNTENIISDCPGAQISEEPGKGSSFDTLQYDCGSSIVKDLSSPNKLNDSNGCADHEILTFPTSCISKPNSHTNAYATQAYNVNSSNLPQQIKVQPSQDPVSFLSSSQENNFQLSKEQPDSIYKTFASSLSHPPSYNPNESSDHHRAKLFDTETGHVQSEDVFQLRPDSAFVINNNFAKGVLTDQSQISSVTSSSSSYGVLQNLVRCISTCQTTTSIVSCSSKMQAIVPRLSGPFPQGSNIAASVTETTSTHSNHCCCIMCSEVIPNNTSLKSKLPTPFLTREEIEIIENGSHRWSHKEKSSLKPNFRQKSSKSPAVSGKFALPKLTPSRELSAAMSIPAEQRNGKPQEFNLKQVNSNVNNILNTTAPPLLLHKSAVKRDLPTPSANPVPSLSSPQIINNHIVSSQTLSHIVPIPAIMVVSTATDSTLSTTSSITGSNRVVVSSSTLPFLFQGSTNAGKIGCLSVKPPVASESSTQSLVNSLQPKDLSTSHHDPKHLLSRKALSKPNDSNSNSSKVTVLAVQPTSVTAANPKFSTVPANAVSLLSSSRLRQELSKPALVSSCGAAKTFQPDPGGQKSVQLPSIGSYQIVYLNSGEVLLCRPMANSKTDVNKSQTVPKLISNQNSKPLIVNGNATSLHSVLNKAEQIDLTNPGTVLIKLIDNKGVSMQIEASKLSKASKQKQQVNPKSMTGCGNSQSLSTVVSKADKKDLTNSGTFSIEPVGNKSAGLDVMKIAKPPTTSQVQSHSVSSSHSSHPLSTPTMGNQAEQCAKKSPLKPSKAPNVTGSTLLKLIDTHIENQQLTSGEAALLQLIKGACKDPELLAATCKIAKQVENASILKSETARKESEPFNANRKSPNPSLTTFAAEKQIGGKGLFVTNSTQSMSERSLQGKLGATKSDTSTTNLLDPKLVPEKEPLSLFENPQPPLEGLPASYIEDWVNQSKTYLSNNKLDNLFCQEIREIDRCMTKEVLQKSQVQRTKSRPKILSKQSLGLRDTSLPKSSLYENEYLGKSNSKEKSPVSSVSEKSRPKFKQFCEPSKNFLSGSVLKKDAGQEDKGKTKSQDNSAESKPLRNAIKFPFKAPHVKKFKHLTSLVTSSKGIKLKIRLDEKLKRHKALKKKALNKNFSKPQDISSTFENTDSSTTEPLDKAQDETNQIPPSETDKISTVDQKDRQESRTETAEEMFQRFQEQAQEEVYKAQLGVGSLSRSLRPARTTVAFIDKLPYRDMGSGERKKKKTEADQTIDQAIPFVNTEVSKSISCSNHPSLKEDTSFPLTKNVYCTNILAGHKVFVRFNTYENLNSQRCFLVPFFNIGGRRKQFDVEDVKYFNKAIIDFEKEERSCARHLLYFCREGKKASFLRKEGSFGVSQLHETSYIKKSFTLEGFKVSAVKPKSSTAQDIWEVDKEVDIEIDTAEVDNDIEEDFDKNFLGNPVKLDQALEVSTKEDGIQPLSDASSCINNNQPVSNNICGHQLLVNTQQEKAKLNLQVVNDGSFDMTCPNKGKGVNNIQPLNEKTDQLSYEKHQDAFMSQAATNEETRISNNSNADPCLSLSEIKKEVPDFYEYGGEFSNSVNMHQSGVSFFQPIFPLMAVKKEPLDTGYDNGGHLSSCTEHPSELACDPSINDKDQKKAKNLSTSSFCHLEKKGLTIAKSFTSEFDHPGLTRTSEDNFLSTSYGMARFEEHPSSIICNEIPVHDAENVQVSLCDEPINSTKTQDKFCDNLKESAGPIKAGISSKSEQDPESREILLDKSEETETGTEEHGPSSPESPAPSSHVSESSEVLSSSDLDESDLNDEFTLSEAHLSYTSTPTVGLIADSEGKTGTGSHKITSLVESLRHRLTQQPSNLPPWLVDAPPPVMHSRLKTKKRKHREKKLNIGNGCKNTAVKQGLNQASRSISVSEFCSETRATDPPYKSEKALAAFDALSNVSTKKAKGENYLSLDVPAKLPLTDNTGSIDFPVQNNFLTIKTISEDGGNSITAIPVSNATEQNSCAEALDADTQLQEANALVSLSLLTGFQTNSKELTVASSHSLTSSSFISDVQTIVKQEILELDSSSVLSEFNGTIAAELGKDSVNVQADERNCESPAHRKENQSAPAVSGRSSPSDIDIEVGFEDVPEAAMKIQQIVPDLWVDVEQSGSSSESSSMSPVAAVVDFLHKRTQAHMENGSRSICNISDTRILPDHVTKDTNTAAKESGSVTNYLTQKYAVDMTPGSGVWHTIKGPRLRKSSVKRPSAGALKLETSTVLSSERLPVVEPISTKELASKPSLSEIFGIPVTINSKPEFEQDLIKAEPVVVENDSEIAIKIGGCKRQVARKRTTTKTMKKDATKTIMEKYASKDTLLISKTEPDETEVATELPFQFTDSVTSLADSIICEDVHEKPVKSSQASDTSSVKSKNLAQNSSNSIPKLRLTWRQLSKLSEKQQKEAELNKVSPCKVLLSRFDNTALSPVIEPIDDFTFRVKENPICVRRDSPSVKPETCAFHQANAVNSVSETNKSRTNKRRKKRACATKSKKGLNKPKKDIVDHFASMLESLRKKALLLEEEATKKQQEEEAKKSDMDNKTLNSDLNATETKQILKEETTTETMVEQNENFAKKEDMFKRDETSFPPLACNSKDEGNFVDHEMKDVTKHVKVNADANQNTFEKAANKVDAMQVSAEGVKNKALHLSSDKGTSSELEDENRVEYRDECAEKMSLKSVSSDLSNKTLDKSMETESIDNKAEHGGNPTQQSICMKLSDEIHEGSLSAARPVNEESSSKQAVLLSNELKSSKDKSLDRSLHEYNSIENGPVKSFARQLVSSNRPDYKVLETNMVAEELESISCEKIIEQRTERTSSSFGSKDDIKSTEENKTTHVREKWYCPQSRSSLNQINLETHNSEKREIAVSEEKSAVLSFESNKLHIFETEKEARKDTKFETELKSVDAAGDKMFDFDSFVNDNGASEEADIHETNTNECEEDDNLVDWEEESALIIHLPEDEIAQQKQIKLRRSASDSDSIEHNLEAKQMFEDNMNSSKSVMEKENDAKRGFDIHGSLKAPKNGKITSLNDGGSLTKFDSMKEDQVGSQISCEGTLECDQNDLEKLSCLSKKTFNFPKTDVVLSSVLDEDLAGCLVEKNIKKDELIMFEHPEDLEGDDMGIIPQDEVERLLGLCDEDSQPVVLPGLGPITIFEKAGSSNTNSQSLNIQNLKEISASSDYLAAVPNSPDHLTKVEIDSKSNTADKVQCQEAEVDKQFDALNNVYRLPTPTTVLSNVSGQQALSKTHDNLNNIASESKDTKIDLSLKGTENSNAKQTHLLQLPKLNLKLDAKAMAAIQKAKTAFLKKKNVNPRRNLRSEVNSEISCSYDNSKDYQFQQDLQFYMRSTKRKLIEEDGSGDLKKSRMASEQQHRNSRISSRSNKKISVALVSKKLNLQDPQTLNEKEITLKHLEQTTASANYNLEPNATATPQKSHDETTCSRKRKVSYIPPLGSSSPTANKVKKVESIFNDTDIFKEPLSGKSSEISLNKSKPITPVSEILKKTKGIDILKLKMKLNPVLSKSSKVPPSPHSKDSNLHQANVLESPFQAPSKLLKISSHNGSARNQDSSCIPLNAVEKDSVVMKQTCQSSKSVTGKVTGASICSGTCEKASAKPLPNLDTAKLCNLLKNIQKRPVDAKFNGDTSKAAKASPLQRKSHEPFLTLESPTRKTPRLIKRVGKQALQRNASSAKESNLHTASQKSQIQPTSAPVAKSLSTCTYTKRTIEDTGDKTERSFFDCLSTDQTEIWEEATH